MFQAIVTVRLGGYPWATLPSGGAASRLEGISKRIAQPAPFFSRLLLYRMQIRYSRGWFDPIVIASSSRVNPSFLGVARDTDPQALTIGIHSFSREGFSLENYCGVTSCNE